MTTEEYKNKLYQELNRMKYELEKLEPESKEYNRLRDYMDGLLYAIDQASLIFLR